MKKSRGGEAGGGRGVKRDRTKCRIEIHEREKGTTRLTRIPETEDRIALDPSIARMFVKNFTFSIIATYTISYPYKSFKKINKFILNLPLKLVR